MKPHHAENLDHDIGGAREGAREKGVVGEDGGVRDGRLQVHRAPSIGGIVVIESVAVELDPPRFDEDPATFAVVAVAVIWPRDSGVPVDVTVFYLRIHAVDINGSAPAFVTEVFLEVPTGEVQPIQLDAGGTCCERRQ